MPSPPPTATTVLCHLADVPDGQARGFDPDHTGRDTMFIVRRGDTLHGWRNACPHVKDAPMAWRKDAYLSGDRKHVVCHGHGARFEIDTGLCVLGACLGERLEPVPVRIDKHGRVCLVVASPEDPLGLALVAPRTATDG